MECDLRENYAEDVVMIEPNTSREYAMYSWRAAPLGGASALSVDSFVVKNGRIVCQTAYDLVSSGGDSSVMG